MKINVKIKENLKMHIAKQTRVFFLAQGQSISRILWPYGVRVLEAAHGERGPRCSTNSTIERGCWGGSPSSWESPIISWLAGRVPSESVRGSQRAWTWPLYCLGPREIVSKRNGHDSAHCSICSNKWQKLLDRIERERKEQPTIRVPALFIW